VLNIGL